MNPILLQKQLKDNATDVENFYNDLKAWGEDMKKKETTQKKNVGNNEAKGTKSDATKKIKLSKEKPKAKIGYTDYSAWDKFDVDAECEKIDYNDNESDLTDEYDETQKDEAYLEKEKGNKFVKDRKWDEAIKCYNKAIDLYSYDPVFYANRALCFLKNENYVKAELDCTMSIRLDSTYVKAYQRRAVAREELGKLAEAEADLLKVLEFEPKNKESSSNLEKLRKKLEETKPPESCQRPVSKFTASRKKKIADNSISNKPIIESTKIKHWSGDTDDIITVKAINKPAHLQSKKPLKRINIEEVSDIETIKESHPKTTTLSKTLRTDDLKIVERQVEQPKVNEMKQNKNNINNAIINKELIVPTNSVQFYSQWHQLKTLEDKSNYIKLIKPESLPNIFKESLESNVFSEILEVLVKCFICNNLDVFYYLKYFSEIRRFSTLVLFLTNSDKNYLEKLFEFVSQQKKQTPEEIDLVLKKYEL